MCAHNGTGIQHSVTVSLKHAHDYELHPLLPARDNAPAATWLGSKVKVLQGCGFVALREMAVESLVSCEWLKQQLDAGRKDLRVLDGMQICSTPSDDVIIKPYLAAVYILYVHVSYTHNLLLRIYVCMVCVHTSCISMRAIATQGRLYTCARVYAL